MNSTVLFFCVYFATIALIKGKYLLVEVETPEDISQGILIVLLNPHDFLPNTCRTHSFALSTLSK